MPYFDTVIIRLGPHLFWKIFVNFLTSTLLRAQNTTLLSKVRQSVFQILWPSQKTQTLQKFCLQFFEKLKVNFVMSLWNDRFSQNTQLWVFWEKLSFHKDIMKLTDIKLVEKVINSSKNFDILNFLVIREVKNVDTIAPHIFLSYRWCDHIAWPHF